MYQKPRRTSELIQEVGSTTRSSRVSRIAQPARNTLSSSRLPAQLTTSDPSLLPVKNLFQSGTTSRHRSSSATPQRTPLRMKTPTRQSKTSQQGTVEKEARNDRTNDKQWISSECSRITDYLRVIEHLLGKDFFDKGGIKNMSTKQFVIIVNHFFKQIAGNRLTVDSNYVETIAKNLSEIEYPYTIAKSWLKTPSAPHAFHNVILLFTWFLKSCPTVPIIKQVEEYESAFISENQDFIDKDYACNFVRQSRKIFSAWNNGSDNVVEEAKMNLANDMIQKACESKGLQDLETKINKLKHEHNEIQSDLKAEMSKIEKYNRLAEEFKTKTKEVDKLRKKTKSNLKEIGDLKLQIEHKEKSVKNAEKRIDEIKKGIKSQKISTEERDELLSQITELNHELQVKVDNIKQQQREGSENQIIFSRLVHKKTALITKLNNYIFNMFTEIKLLNSFEVNELSLKKDCQIKEIEQLNVIMQKISNQLVVETLRIENEVKRLQELVTLLKTEEVTYVKPTLQKCNEQLDELNEKLKKVEEAILAQKNNNERQVKELEAQIHDLQLAKNQMLSKLETKTEALNSLKETNLHTWNDFESKMDKILTYREKKVDTLSEAVDDFYKTVEGLHKFVAENE